jgi:hypothetical protein
MTNHLKRKQDCPNINNLELTEEIKNIILNDRVYHPPKNDVKKKKEIVEVVHELEYTTSNVDTSTATNDKLDGVNIVYLIKLREHINHNENVFKLGRTSRTMRERLNGYSKGSEVVCQFNCNHTTNAKMEKHLKDAFARDTEEFKMRTDLGTEFVEGKPLQVLCKFLDVIKTFDVM